MKQYSVYDKEFAEYGRVVDGYDVDSLLDILKRRECPEDGVVYVPSDKELESLPAAKRIQDSLYGTLPIQIGYTNGHNRKMNALEYHRDSEYNVADKDIVLLLGRRQDLTADFVLDTDTVKAFLVPKGVLVEVYATSLHYAPCQTSEEGYRCIVVLPKGTNLPVEKGTHAQGEEYLLAAANKWLIAHPDGGCGENVFTGLKGKNIEI